jgi:hypothetical protein
MHPACRGYRSAALSRIADVVIGPFRALTMTVGLRCLARTSLCVAGRDALVVGTHAARDRFGGKLRLTADIGAGVQISLLVHGRFSSRFDVARREVDARQPGTDEPLATGLLRSVAQAGRGIG